LITVHGTVIPFLIFLEARILRKKSRSFGSETKLMWDGGGFRVFDEILVELAKRYDHESQLDLDFTAYDSIHGDSNQY